MKLEKKCNPKTCPILFGCFLERESMGSIGNVMKARLLYWLKLGSEAITGKKYD